MATDDDMCFPEILTSFNKKSLADAAIGAYLCTMKAMIIK